jgi:hypothetical protein
MARKWISRLSLALLLLAAGFAVFLYTRFQDRFPGYSVDINIKNDRPTPLRAGFAALPITPTVPDEWTDANGDARFVEEDGDTWTDGNGNGRFDAVWMAGFQNRRAAQGIHDDLWARAMVVEDDSTRIALVSLDAIGFGNDDVIRVRKLIADSTGLDYVIVASTHTHESPDLMGLWGESEYRSGVDPAYMHMVQQQAARAVEMAVANLRPAVFRIGQDISGAKPLVMDTREPQVMDEGLLLLQALDAATGQTLGTLIQWANHPETTWNENLQISSDFPHYLREAVEKGIYAGDSLLVPGVGGVCVYVNGAIGGLMTTLPDFGVADLASDSVFLEPTFRKAAAQGRRIAALALEQFHSDSLLTRVDSAAIRLRASSIELPLDNKLFRLAAALGVLDRGMSGWMKLRTEVAVWRLGPATFLHQPGEIYPEIVNGGIEQPEGRDFEISPVEVPPLRDLMPGTFKFTVGLSSDQIGYILPKSQWDESPPYTFGMKEAPYGEINSVGPETGPLVYKALVKILEEVK